MGACLAHSRNSKEAIVAGGSGVKGLAVGDTVRKVMDMVQVPDHGHLKAIVRTLAVLKLTGIGSHWKVLRVKDCCDLTYILKGLSWLLCR